jgi:monofunctional biosynthetic peptidoglycan transglycosylase
MRRLGTTLLRLVLLCTLAGVALQLYFLLRIVLMLVLDPQSTTFQRSEAWRIVTSTGELPWRQQWVPYEDMSDHLKRAVIASEDAGFNEHDGVDWEALEKAWERNQRALAQAERANERLKARAARPPGQDLAPRQPRIVGGSTITQQLAKNLFLSRDKEVGRKVQELAIAFLLESALGKERILEIYLNIIEWGPGLRGLRPAARHYFGREPQALTPAEIAFLVAIIPGPIKYQRSIARGTPGPGLRSLIDALLAKLRSVDAIGEEEYRRALTELILVNGGRQPG